MFVVLLFYLQISQILSLIPEQYESLDQKLLKRSQGIFLISFSINLSKKVMIFWLVCLREMNVSEKTLTS